MIIETEIEDDGRWIAEIPDLPGILVYGVTQEEAIYKVKVLALRILAERLKHGEETPDLDELFNVADSFCLAEHVRLKCKKRFSAC
ncbi:type II toxin-antitoxin system HicB family antitoxin [Desulfobacter sp.]